MKIYKRSIFGLQQCYREQTAGQCNQKGLVSYFKLGGSDISQR